MNKMKVKQDINARPKRANHILKISIFLVLILIGSILRWLCSSRGYNLDIESWHIVAGVVESGGNVYHETTRYNYGPVWFEILAQLQNSLIYDQPSIEALRYRITFFLILVDIGICLFLFLNHGLKVSAIFFLNPISIIISGYHGQFDNLAILFGLLAIWFYQRGQGNGLLVFSLFLIGISLATKHFLFLLPLWLAFRERQWSKKIVTLFIPYSVFIGSFLFYAKGGLEGIINNVFLYRSFNNAPIWHLLLPEVIYQSLSMFSLFIGSMVAVGYFLRDQSPLRIFYIYLIAVVAFSSAVANQYLAIPVAAISVFTSLPLIIYTLVAGTFLALNSDGLHFYNSEYLRFISNQSVYEFLCFMLTLGIFRIFYLYHKFFK